MTLKISCHQRPDKARTSKWGRILSMALAPLVRPMHWGPGSACGERHAARHVVCHVCVSMALSWICLRTVCEQKPDHAVQGMLRYVLSFVTATLPDYR